MPVERRSTSAQIRTAIIAMVSLVLVGVTVWFLVTNSPFGAGSGNQRTVRLGSDVFEAGNAERLAGQIDRTGPFLFSDVSGRGQNRPIIVNHLGDGWKIGWVAFDALEPDQGDGCFIQVDPEDGTLFGSCTGREYPQDGEGLRQYPWKVEQDGVLVIDLRTGDTQSDTQSDTGSDTGAGAGG